MPDPYSIDDLFAHDQAGSDPLAQFRRPLPVDYDRPGLLGSHQQLLEFARQRDAAQPTGPDPSGAYGDGLGQIKADPAPSPWSATKGLLNVFPPTSRPPADPAAIDIVGKALAPPDFTASGPKYPDSLDPVIDQAVADYNRLHGFQAGDREYMDPDLVRAMVRQEAGHNRHAYSSDPMQMNGPDGDWDERKATLGIEKGVAPGGPLSVRAGVDWLGYKAYEYGRDGKPFRFRGWPEAVQRYNAKLPDYSARVMQHLDDIRKGR
jgi:hypothetical protein